VLWFLPLISFAQLEKETHLANIKQATFGGLNAEAYFSSDEKNLYTNRQKGWNFDLYLIESTMTEKILNK
jgi:hypothetical protein